MNSHLFLLILSFILFVDCGFVKRSGLQLLDGDDNDLYLKGVNLESWLMIQMLILSSAGGELRGETFFKTKLTEIIGQAETDEFMKKLYANFITEDDIIAIAELGFNNVRVNFNHIVLENMNEDPVTCCSESGWKIFDDLVQWCESAQVYVIFDLHSTPGGQSEFFVNDPDDDSSTHIWNDETNAARTEEIWRQIATRYKDKEIILGYDLLNEPGPPNTRTLLAMYERLTTAIRAVDQNHVVIVEANALGAFDDWTPVKDDNTIYSSHLYQFVDAIPSRQIQTDAWRRDVIKRDKRPLYVGEFGHADNTWIRESVAMMREPGYVGWSFWTWKKLNDLFVVTCLVDSPPKWQQFIDWANGKWFVEKPAKQDVLGVMDEIMQGLRFDKKCLQQQTIAALVNGTSTSASHASSLSGVVKLLCMFVLYIYWQ